MKGVNRHAVRALVVEVTWVDSHASIMPEIAGASNEIIALVKLIGIDHSLL